MRTWLLAVSWLILSNIHPAQADVQVRVQHPLSRGAFTTAVGSQITIELPNQNAPRAGLFLGRVVKPDGKLDSYMLLDTKTQNVLYVPAPAARIDDRGLENVLDTSVQKGGTCTGYAIDNFLMQTHFSGRGNGQLAKVLSTEEGRTGLLVDAVNQYYLVLQHRFSIRGILDAYGKRFGFQCRSRTFDHSQAAHEYLKSQLAFGAPVLISFNTGPEMRTSPFEFLAMRPTSWARLDRRLWVPRKIGERAAGGHSVVASSFFYHQGRLELVMIDSDWDQPRIWDAEDYLDQKTAIQEVEFISCS